MVKARRRFIRIKSAVLVLQSAKKVVKNARINARIQQDASIVIQSTFRMFKSRRSFLSIKSAVLVLQSVFLVWKAKKVFKNARLKRDASIIIQANFRMIKARRSFVRIKSAILVLQSVFHLWKARMVVNNARLEREASRSQANAHLELERDASIIIQSSFKMFKARKSFLKLRSSSIIFQSNFRMFKSRKRFVGIQSAVLVLQCVFRLWKARIVVKNARHERDASIVIQSFYRMFHTRKSFLRVMSAIRLLQSVFRGFIVHKRFQNQNLASITIQKYWRRYSSVKFFKRKLLSIIFMQSNFRRIISSKQSNSFFELKDTSSDVDTSTVINEISSPTQKTIQLDRMLESDILSDLDSGTVVCDTLSSKNIDFKDIQRNSINVWVTSVGNNQVTDILKSNNSHLPETISDNDLIPRDIPVFEEDPAIKNTEIDVDDVQEDLPKGINTNDSQSASTKSSVYYSNELDLTTTTTEQTPLNSIDEFVSFDSNTELSDISISNDTQNIHSSDLFVSIHSNFTENQESEESNQETNPEVTNSSISSIAGLTAISSSIAIGLSATSAATGSAATGFVASGIATGGLASALGAAGVVSGFAASGVLVPLVATAGVLSISGMEIHPKKRVVIGDVNDRERDDVLDVVNESVDVVNTNGIIVVEKAGESTDNLVVNREHKQIIDQNVENTSESSTSEFPNLDSYILSDPTNDPNNNEGPEMQVIHDFLLPIVQLAAKPFISLRKEWNGVEGTIEYDENGRIINLEESRMVYRDGVVSDGGHYRSGSYSTPNKVSRNRKLSTDSTYSFNSENSEALSESYRGKEMSSWQKSISLQKLRKRPSVDMRDLSALAITIKTKMEELEACYKMMCSLKTTLWESPISIKRDSSTKKRFSGRAAKQTYVEISSEIHMIGKGIGRLWTPVARRCSDERLRTHLVSSLQKMETLSSQLRAVVSMKSNDIYDMDEGGAVLICAGNLCGCVGEALKDLEAAGIRIEEKNM